MAIAQTLLTKLKHFAGKAASTAGSDGCEQELRLARETITKKNRRLKALRQRVEERDRELARRRAGSVRSAENEAGGVRSENVVWIFGAGRSGTTWLASMLGELGTFWNEPLIGALFGEFYEERQGSKRGRNFILGRQHREVWIDAIRTMVLRGAAARYPEALEGGCVVIKEPHGSMGAPLLMEALPESRMVLLVRDPRDVISSRKDARREGGWTERSREKYGKKKGEAVIADQSAFAGKMAQEYMRSVGKAREAYENHEGPKALIRYEDLRGDTLAVVRRLCSELGISVAEDDLARAVEKHAWENIPEEEKGEGKRHRKATPGGWREDLTPEQAETVESITAPVLKEFYSD